MRLPKHILTLSSLAVIVLTGCNAIPQQSPAPTVIPLAATITTCAEAIQTAIRELACDQAVCTRFIEFNSENPAENHIGISTQSRIDTIQLEGSSAADVKKVWRQTVLTLSDRENPVTLVVNGDATLTGITPQLDELTLSTELSPTCEDAPPPSLIVQVPRSEQINLTLNGVGITVGTTAAFTAVPNERLVIYGLAGLSVVSSEGSTQVVRAGESTAVAANGGPPMEAQAFDLSLYDQLPLAVLPEFINVPDVSPQQPTTAPVRGNDVVSNAGTTELSEENCIPNASWAGEHTVQRGENLTNIAARYNVTLDELQSGNCITNPNRILPGQVLTVPAATTPLNNLQSTGASDNNTPVPVIIPTLATAGNSPLTVNPPGTIAPGECADLQWTVTDAAQVYLNEIPVDAEGQQQVCPQTTTTFTLRVVQDDGQQLTYSQLVQIAG